MGSGTIGYFLILRKLFYYRHLELATWVAQQLRLLSDEVSERCSRLLVSTFEELGDTDSIAHLAYKVDMPRRERIPLPMLHQLEAIRTGLKIGERDKKVRTIIVSRDTEVRPIRMEVRNILLEAFELLVA